MAQVMTMAAVQGVSGFYVYSYDGTLSGDYITDSDGVITAFNRVSDILCGKTISEAWQMWDGSVRVVVDGVSHIF